MQATDAIPHSKIWQMLAPPTKWYSIVWCCRVANYAMLLMTFVWPSYLYIYWHLLASL